MKKRATFHPSILNIELNPYNFGFLQKNFSHPALVTFCTANTDTKRYMRTRI